MTFLNNKKKFKKKFTLKKLKFFMIKLKDIF